MSDEPKKPAIAVALEYEIGTRFLADYLNGDVYFKVHRAGHNLDRCRTQFKLVREMQTRMGEMQDIVRRHLAGVR